jgi:hypothetical protein
MHTLMRVASSQPKKLEKDEKDKKTNKLPAAPAQGFPNKPPPPVEDEMADARHDGRTH